MTTNILKKKIKEVNDYFIAKMISGDFKVIEVLKSRVELKIDNEFKFSIWMISGAEYVSTTAGAGTSDFNLIFSEEEKEKIYNLLIDEYKKVKGSIERAEYERLKAKFEII